MDEYKQAIIKMYDEVAPLSKGNFWSSRFLVMLNREELCLRFFTTVVPVILTLLIWVGGGGPVANFGPDEGELPGLDLPLYKKKLKK